MFLLPGLQFVVLRLSIFFYFIFLDLFFFCLHILDYLLSYHCQYALI